MGEPFRYDASLTDYGATTSFVEASEKLRATQVAARRKQQREAARLRRQTDREWIEKRNAYMKAYRSKAPTLKDENPHDPRNPAEHGTVQRYRRYKCRCPRCTMANRDAARIRRTGDAGPEENLR